MSEHLIVVGVIGPDRPGLLVSVTAALVPLGIYHDDPKSSLLPGGNVVMLLVIRADVTVQRVRAALRSVDRSGGLVIEAYELQDRTSEVVPPHARYVLRIHSTGRPGVLAEFAKIVARHGGTVLDFGTRVGGGRISVLRVELVDEDPDRLHALERDLWLAGEQMGIGIKFYNPALGENAPLP